MAGQNTGIQPAASPRSRGLGRVTLADVAREAGVHITTVSAVLNRREHCYASDQTRRRVFDAARSLNYRPSALARGLSGQRTGTIGMITTGYDFEHATRTLYGVENAAREKGLFVLTASTRNDSAIEDQIIQQMIDRGVDGILIVPSEYGDHTELRRLVERDFPIVAIGTPDRRKLTMDVVYDDVRNAGILQARHLIACGFRNIWLVTFSERCEVNDQKIDGFDQAMNEAGASARRFVVQDPLYSIYSQNQTEFDQVRELLRNHAGEMDALACPGDALAQAVLRIAIEEGLRVPDDLAVIGMGAQSSSANGAIPLSTIGYDAEGLGRSAFDLLSDQLDRKHRPPKPRRVVIEPYLIARVSTLGRPKKWNRSQHPSPLEFTS